MADLTAHLYCSPSPLTFTAYLHCLLSPLVLLNHTVLHTSHFVATALHGDLARNMTTLPQPVPSPLSKPDIAQRCPIYASFLDELRRLRRAHIDAPSPDNDPTLCEQLYASFKTFCSTYRKAHPDEDGKYATLWPTYIDKVVLNPKQSRQKRHARSFTTQPPASKVPRTDEPPSSSSSSFRTSDHPLVSSSSDSLSSPSSSTAFVAGACSASHALPEHDVGFQAVVDEIAKLRSEMKQLAAVPLTPSTGELNDVQESKQEELPSVNAQQQQQIEQLAQQLADTQAAEATTQHELAAVRKQLDDMQQRWEQAEKEQLQNEKQTTEKCQLSILQGYVLRACDELVMDCPLYNQPLSSPDQLKYLTKQRTSRVLNCLKDFAALCSTFAEHAQYAVDATSSERQAQKAYRKLSLVLHPDKLLAHIDGERKGHTLSCCILPTRLPLPAHSLRLHVCTCVLSALLDCIHRSGIRRGQGVCRADGGVGQRPCRR